MQIGNDEHKNHSRFHLFSGLFSIMQDENFNNVVAEAREAIALGIYPQLISAGSSGSYYVFNKNKKPIAVFKPKDEGKFLS